MGSKDEVQVLGGWFSPFAHRVEVALKLKEIPYEVLEQDLQNKSDLLLEYNPVYKKIPVLVHNQKPISESLVIIEYLDDVWKDNYPLLSQDPCQKANQRFWAKFIEEKLTEVARMIIITEGEEQEKRVKQAKEALEILEEELKGKKYFGGEAIGFVDVVLCWTAIWLPVIEEATSVKLHEPGNFPLLEKWKQNILELPVIKEITPQHNMLLEYFVPIRELALAPGK